jgi:exopolysaccharide biosynthesis polyprenyl glycosylphosphotransferase
MSRMTLVLSFVLIHMLMTISRFVSFKVIQEAHRRGIGHRNVLIYGDGESARWLQRKFLLVPTLGLRLVGLISAERSHVGRLLERSRVLGTLDDLEALVREHKVSEVFVAAPESSEDHLMEVIERLEKLGVAFRVVPRFYHLMSQRIRIENFHSIPLISRPERRISLLSAVGKRVLDVLFALCVLVLAAPVFLAAAVLIRRESEGPVFFRQVRIGLDGRPFRMLKFRTMYTHLSGDAPKPATSEDPRVTRTGRLLRRYSLDELPQFINVLLGSMSVVGPRPEMPFIVERYGALERERLRAKPGITGLWQISYARQAAIHENLDYDIYYVENRSLLLDVVIIVLTCFAVMKGTGAH